MLLYAKVMLHFSWNVYILLDTCLNLCEDLCKRNLSIHKHNKDEIDMVARTKHLKNLSLLLKVLIKANKCI